MSATTLSPIAKRFAWKEYRTLRSFWLAAFVLAVLVQAVTIALRPRRLRSGDDCVRHRLGGGRPLRRRRRRHDVFDGARRRNLLLPRPDLPTRWFPLFAGKLSFAITSSLALAVALTICGTILSGGNLPSRDFTLLTLGVFGFAIVELIAWGTFFSLLIRQPLLAALLAIGAESLTLSIAVNADAYFVQPAIILSAYFRVLPLRLAIAACVFAIDILLARRWLTSHEPRSSIKHCIGNEINIRRQDA